jgi:hypothetical protein
VNKGGFLAALAKGLFGTIMVVVICGTALGLYGLYVVDKHVGGAAQQILANLPEWQKLLPPVLADSLNDRRAPEYRPSLDITARYVPAADQDDRGQVVLNVRNNGTQTVSLLTLHTVVEDESDRRFCELTMTPATPLSFGDECGPLLPGSERQIAKAVWQVVGTPKIKFDVSELRVWNGPAEKPESSTATPPPALADRPALP